MKITGAEWKSFEEHGWPEGYVWSDESLLEDGRDVENVTSDEVFVVPDYWSVYWEGDEQRPGSTTDEMTIRSLIRKWRKTRHFVTLVVTVPKSDEQKAKDTVASNGWRIA